MQFTAAQLANMLQGTIDGDANAQVNSIGKIESAQPNELCFLSNPKYENYLYTSKAGIVLVNNNLQLKQPVSATLIRVVDAYKAFALLLQQYQTIVEQQFKKTGIATSAHIEDSATIGKDVYIGPFVYVGKHATVLDGAQLHAHVMVDDAAHIGNNTKIYSGVKIYRQCVVGNNCIVHAGVIIGADGFGFAKDANGVQIKIPQLGNVIIKDNVEIGANTCIDRATVGSTIIGKGVKLDNLIQVGHNVTIGDNTVIAAGTAISGSTHLGSNLTVGGQVGFAGHITVANGVMIGGQSGITKSITEENRVVNGTPAMDFKQSMKSAAALKNLPDLLQRVTEIEKKVNNLINE